MLKIDFDFSSLEAKLDAITDAAEEAVRPAAQAGAQVYYDEVRARVPVSARAHKWRGKLYQPGTLKAAIYQVYSTDNSDETKATYHISWNHKKAGHGYWIENGNRRQAAQPFLRPSYDAMRTVAGEAVQAEIVKRVGEKLA